MTATVTLRRRAATGALCAPRRMLNRSTRLLAPRFVRHPAQLGTSKLGLGAALMLAHWLTVAALVARRLGCWRGLLLAAPALL